MIVCLGAFLVPILHEDQQSVPVLCHCNGWQEVGALSQFIEGVFPEAQIINL